jgi:TrmH family RNA methyltransferase
MGAIFSVPVVQTTDIDRLPGLKVALVADAVHDEKPFGSEGWNQLASRSGGVTLMIGSEREGLPQAVREAADVTARIPIQTHSLNAAMAATVALYEFTRSRRMAPE